MNTQHGASPPTILVLNSGSSSLKFGLFAHSGDDESLLLEGSALGFDYSIASLTGGVTFRPLDDVTLGLAGGYDRGDADLDDWDASTTSPPTGSAPPRIP